MQDLARLLSADTKKHAVLLQAKLRRKMGGNTQVGIFIGSAFLFIVFHGLSRISTRAARAKRNRLIRLVGHSASGVFLNVSNL